MKVLVSDEIADKIDINQFYEQSGDLSDIILTLWTNGVPITGSINKIRITGKKSCFVFVCSSDNISSFILGEKISNLSLFKSGVDDAIIEYSNFEVTSRSLKPSDDGYYECELIIRMLNT